MARQRDYKAEYARRVERGRELGLSRSQARGHPGKGQPKAKAVIAEIRKIAPEKVKPKRAPKQQKQTGPKVPPQKNRGAGGRNVIIKGRGKHGKDRQGIAWQGKGGRRLLAQIDALAQATPERKIWIAVEDVDGIWRTLYSETAAQKIKEYADSYDDVDVWIRQALGDRYESGDIGRAIAGVEEDQLPGDFGWEVMAVA